MSIRCLFVVCVLLASFPTRDAAAELFGVVASGEACLLAGTGCTDAGKLVELDPTNGNVVRVVGDTGLESLSALAFDPARSSGGIATPARLVAGVAVGELHLIDPETAAATELVSFLAFPPAAEFPPDVVVAGPPRFLLSLDFDSQGTLFGIVSDTLTDFLVRLDLTQVESNGRLEVDVIGVVGTTNGAVAGAPLGFSSPQIAFNQINQELFGVGLEIGGGSAFPFLLRIQTAPGALPLAQTVGLQANSFQSFARGMAADPVDGTLYVTGIRDVGGGALEDVLVVLQGTGEDNVVGPVTLDGQVTGLAFVALLDEDGPRAPSIASFTPAGGNAGVVVLISGTGFSADGQPNVSEVRFGPTGNQVDAIGAISILGDDLLRVMAPGAATGPIEVSNPQGTAVSAENFVRSEFVVIDAEANQGIPDLHQLVRGKETVLRLFPASSEAVLGGPPVPVVIESAEAVVITPLGDTIRIPAELYTPTFSNPPNATELSHRHSINAFIDGELLEGAGTYNVFFDVRGVGPTGPPGPIITTHQMEFELTPSFRLEVTSLAIRCPERDLPLLAIIGGFQDEAGNFVGPEDNEMETFLRLFPELSRVWPVRDGVSQLGQDENAGVRFDFSPLRIVLPLERDEDGEVIPFGIDDINFDSLDATATQLLDSYNDANSDDARYAQVYFGGAALDCFCGKGEKPGDVSFTRLNRFIPDAVPTRFFPAEENTTEVPIHELGHNHGLVDDTSPNSNGDSHSSNDKFETDPRVLHPFNLPARRALEDPPGTFMFPSPTFFGVTGKQFLEPFEFNSLVERPFGCPDPAATSAPAFRSITGSADTFVAIVKIGREGSAELLRSYATRDRELTSVDPESPFTLAFLDTSGEVLSEEPFEVNDALSDGADGARESVTVSVIRPLPDGTHRIEVRKDGSSLAGVQRSASAPELELLFPLGGESFGADEEVTVRWSGADPEGDPLRFDVSYSPDGVRFLPVAVSVEGASFSWSLGLTPGTDGGIIRVTASDGFHRSSVESGPISVGRKPPIATIVRPLTDQVFFEFDVIALEASAYDLRNGVLDGDALQWESDVEGALGTGRRLDLAAATLRPGLHQLTLHVASDGGSATRNVAVLVLADADRDGIPDEDEQLFDSLNPDDPYDAGGDADGDGLTAAQEIFFRTSPDNADTDGDGISDSDEISSGSSPISLPPELDPIGDQDVLEGENLTLVVNASDPDGDPISFSATGLPAGASFEAESRTFSYTPGFDVSTKLGDMIFEIAFTVVDIFGDRDSETVQLRVIDVNRPPVAACQDVSAFADESCQADVSIDAGSFDPDDDLLTLTQDPAGPYGLGLTEVTLTVTDGAESDMCDATVTVEDNTLPQLMCNIPASGTITPPDAPISFTATATDNCAVASVEISEYDCFKITKKGKRIDKKDSCDVKLAGDTITIVDSGGVDDNIAWIVDAVDVSGNSQVIECAIKVANPGKK